MGKINKLWTVLNIILLIILVIFNAFFFSLGVYSASAWISYVFIHFAFLLVFITPLFIKKRNVPPVFGDSFFLAISAVYFLLALIAGVIFILASIESGNIEQMTGLLKILIPPHYVAAGLLAVSILKNVTTALVVHACIAGIYAIVLIVNVAANKHTAEALEKRKEQVDYIKIASAKLKLLSDKVNDKEAKRKVESVYDAVSSSPVKSHIDLTDLETRILQNINELDNEISADNKDKIISLSNKLLSDVNERNTRLRMLN